MKRISFTLIFILGTITACISTTNQPIATNDPSDISQPSPSPADSNLVRGNVYLDSTELISTESYPLQFALLLKGNLPTPCHELRITVSPPDSQNKIAIDAHSVKDPNAICVQVLEPFEENIPLGSFPSGHYTLWINGEQITEFDS
jgi:hypothetical protein